MALNASRLSAAILNKATSSGKIKAGPDGTIEAMCDAIAQAVIEEITLFAEIPVVPPAIILPGTVSIGAGPAAAPTPAPIPTQQPPIPPGSIK
jgi:hypothetical protein